MPWRRKWQSTPVFLPGESHGQRTWQAAVCGVTKSGTRLSKQHFPQIRAQSHPRCPWLKDPQATSISTRQATSSQGPTTTPSPVSPGSVIHTSHDWGNRHTGDYSFIIKDITQEQPLGLRGQSVGEGRCRDSTPSPPPWNTVSMFPAQCSPNQKLPELHHSKSPGWDSRHDWLNNWPWDGTQSPVCPFLLLGGGGGSGELKGTSLTQIRVKVQKVSF